MNPSERKEIYRTQAGILKIPVFFQPWWLDIVCRKGNWEVCLAQDGQGNLTGVLPYFLTTFLGCKIIRMPPFTPYLGVWLNYPEMSMRVVKKYSFENEVIGKLIEQLPEAAWYHQIHPEQLENWFPFYRKGYRQTTRYTYLFNNVHPEVIFTQMKSSVRNKISLARKNLEVEESREVESFLPLLKRTLNRNEIFDARSMPMMKELCHAVLNNNQGKLLIAKTRAIKQPVAGLMAVWDRNSYYLWQLGVHTGAADSTGAAQLLIWEAILDAMAHELEFNFEGSMLPHIEPVFRAFGAERRPVFQIRKFGNRFLEAAWVLFNGK